MKRLLLLLKSKILFFLLTTGVILSLNLTPLVLQYFHAPPGRSFALIHNNVQDFYFYQSLMNEGANGAYLTSDPYTTEPHQSSIIFSYFVWIGKIAKILNIPYAYIYHFLRLSISIIFLLFTFYFIFLIKIPYPRLTYFFFLFASPFMRITEEFGKTIRAPYMHWWTGLDPIRRAAYLPHHMFGALGLIISLYLVIRFHQKKGKKHLYYLFIFSLLLAFIHTPSLFIILIILPPTIIIYTLRNSNIHKFFGSLVYQFFSLSVYWFTGLIVLLIMVSQTNHGFPWSQYINWEKNLQFPLNKELIGTFGILLPLSLLGLIRSLLSKKFDRILIGCWFLAPLLLIPFSYQLGISNIRLLQGVPFLSLTILACIGLETIMDFINSSRGTPLSGATKANFSLLIIIIIFLIFSLPTLTWSLNDQIKEFWPIYGNVYPDIRLNNVFYFINQNFPPKTITLSTFYTGNYLPAFTSTVSFIGHSGYTFDIDKKQALANTFFTGKMPTADAKKLLQDYKIALIFQGPEEKPIYPSLLYPQLLKPIYNKEEVTLYIPNF